MSSVLDYEGWIQTLSTHPIFRAESSSRSSHYLSDKRNSRVPHRQLVVRETDLIVAVGSEIRAISLKLCKDVCIKANISRHSIKKGGSMQYTLECMRKAVQSVPFAILGSSGVDFHIKQLSLSPNGDMLAISGESRLAIMSLPRPATIRVIRSDSTLRSLHLPSLTESSVEVQNVVEVPVLDCRVLYVSEGHDKNGKTETSEVDRGSHSTPYGSWTSGKGNMKISKTLWHPCSSRGSHLLVLYQAGYVKMFDVSQSVDVPEQVFDMTTSMQADAPYRSVELASFCFGNQKSNDWGRITLYIATNWGDIYTLSPVVPESWIADKSWLEDLLVQSQTQIRERQGEEYTLNKQRILSPELAKAISQEQWITAALSSAKALGNNSLCQIVAKGIKLRTTLLQSPAPQGPYLLQPEPPIASDDESSDSSSNDDSDATDSSDGQSSEDFSTSSGPKFNEDSVCDIACLETSPVGIICLGYNNGHIDTFAILDPVSGQWPFQKNVKVDKTDSLPTLVTLESIVLHGVKPASTVGQILKPLGRNGRIPGHFVTDPNYPYTLFYAHERGVHFINLKAWDSYFKDALLRETTVSFGSTEKAPVQLPEGSDIRCLVNTHPVNTKRNLPIVGVVLIDDVYLPRSLLALASPLQYIGIHLPSIMADDKCTTDKTEVHGEQGPNTKVKYVPQLPNAPYQPPNEILAQIAPTSHPHVVFNKSLRPQDMEKDDFKRFGEISIDLRQKMRALVDASEEMNIRIGLQQKEHERQKSKLSELSSNLNQGIIPKIHGHMDRLKSLKENQNKIGLRIDCLIRDLVDHCQLPLSQIEVNFIKFVRELDGKVSGPGGCQGQLDQLTELFQKLNRETQAFNKKSQERDRPHDRFSTRLDYIDAGHDDRRGSLSPSSYLSPKTQNPSNQRFGAHQLKAIEDALSSEQRLLNETIANINEANQELSKFKA